MKLTGKIILIYMIAIGLLTSLFGYSIVRREDARLRNELERTARSVGVAMEKELVVAWNSNGHEGVTRMIRQVDGLHQEMKIGWIAMNVRQQALDPNMPVDRLARADQGNVLTILSHDSQRSYYPIDIAEQRAGCLEFSQPLEPVERYTQGTVFHTSTLVLGMLVCGGFVTLLGIRFVGRPLEQLIAKTKRIGEGDFSDPLELQGHDELNELAGALNQMCDKLADQQLKLQSESSARIAAVEQLRHVDRLNTVGRLASGVAHELGTPLNVVSGRAELIASGQLDLEQCRSSALAIKSEADRMANIIRQLLDFARRRTPQRTSVNLRDVAEQSVELLQSLAKKHQVEVEVRGETTLTAHVDAGQIQQVLTNLIVNAIQAISDRGTVTVALQQQSAQRPGATASPTETYCCISVTDNGAGINEEDREHLFEPFFTTKDVGEGTGLGLSVSYGIIQDHGGWIDVHSEVGQGSCFTVYLPCS